MLCGSRTANMAVMNGTTNLITVPMMFLAGVWFSRHNFPDWMATATRFLPLSALADGLRKIALEGEGLAGVGVEAGILALYLCVCTVLARRFFKWY